MLDKIFEFWADESGASPFTEYALLAGIVSMAGIFGLTVIGGALRNYFTDLSSTLTTIASAI